MIREDRLLFERPGEASEPHPDGASIAGQLAHGRANTSAGRSRTPRVVFRAEAWSGFPHNS
jgi:hypothetical protein